MIEDKKRFEPFPDQFLIVRLEYLTRRLDTFASACFGGLLTMLLLLAIMSLVLSRVLVYPGIQIIVSASCAILITNLLALFAFERALKVGDTLFNELSDEFEWNISSNRIAYGVNVKGKPDFEIRIALRNFIKSSELPLLPGRSGIRWYLIVNLTIWSIILFFGTISSGSL